MIKENLTERIVIDRISLRLEILEEENKELVTDYHANMKEFKLEAEDDQTRIKEYNTEIDKLIKQKETLKLQTEQLLKETVDLRVSNMGEIK